MLVNGLSSRTVAALLWQLYARLPLVFSSYASDPQVARGDRSLSVLLAPATGQQSAGDPQRHLSSSSTRSTTSRSSAAQRAADVDPGLQVTDKRFFEIYSALKCLEVHCTARCAVDSRNTVHLCYDWRAIWFIQNCYGTVM